MYAWNFSPVSTSILTFPFSSIIAVILPLKEFRILDVRDSAEITILAGSMLRCVSSPFDEVISILVLPVCTLVNAPNP